MNPPAAETPIAMVLFCPNCGLQHIDEPCGEWANPPHRSHLCHGCGHIWRPCDRPTTGVAGVGSRGERDGPVISTMTVPARAAARLREKLNTPQLANFSEAVISEAAHQRERWGSEHDAGKGPLDWFWLIGFLAQKAAFAAIAGDVEKALHHTISTAAALANWHAALAGDDNRMRPGIETPAGERG